jgi:hypothetical protein
VAGIVISADGNFVEHVAGFSAMVLDTVSDDGADLTVLLSSIRL